MPKKSTKRIDSWGLGPPIHTPPERDSAGCLIITPIEQKWSPPKPKPWQKRKPKPKKQERPDGIDPYYRSAAWRKLRDEVRLRDLFRCQYCGGHGIQADHIMPRRQGGPDVLGNLVCCCESCNRIAGGRVFRSFEAKKRFILKHRKCG